MAKANMLDPRARAKKKQKQAIVLGLLFAALVAFQGPRYMKLLSPPDTGTAATSTSSTSTGTSGTDATSVGSGTALAVASTSGDSLVVQADLAPAPLEGQLGDFTLFKAKDPFKQRQVAGTRPVGSPARSASNARLSVTPSTAQPPAGVGQVSPVAAPPSSSSTQPTTAQPAVPTVATISVNGVQEAVNVAADFPAAAPLFHLVKLSAKAAAISVAGGSLASGAPTVTLKLGKPLTLMNTADGTRFVLILVNTTGSPSAVTTTPTPPAPTP
jgi:hypothetical protein